MKKNLFASLFALAITLVSARAASAQTTQPTEVMYHWGPLHKAVGQAIVLNAELTDHFGDPTLTVPVTITLEDKDGNAVYSNTITLSAGHSFSGVFIVGPDIRTARSTIPADIYGAVGPDVRLIQPCLKVTFPPGPTSPGDQFFATLEVVDVVTGRVQVLLNNPNIRFGLGVPQ